MIRKAIYIEFEETDIYGYNSGCFIPYIQKIDLKEFRESNSYYKESLRLACIMILKKFDTSMMSEKTIKLSDKKAQKDLELESIKYD